MGLLDRQHKASRFVLELPWASFARFWLPKMVVRASWGRLWLVFGAPQNLSGGGVRLRLTALNPQNCPSKFDTLFFLVAVVVAVVAVAAAVVVFVAVAADAAADAAAAVVVLVVVVVDDNECNQGTGGHRAASSITKSCEPTGRPTRSQEPLTPNKR